MGNQDMTDDFKRRYDQFGDNANLINMVHNFLQEEGRANHQKRIDEGRTGKFYPSSVGRCNRQIAYQMLGYPGADKAGQTILIMDNGTYFHNRMEDMFERMGILVAPELKLVDPDLRISGRSDAIIWNFLKEEDEPDGEIISLYQPKAIFVADGEDIEVISEVYHGPANNVMIVEFKSIKSKNYDKLPKSKPKKEHAMQLQLYMYMTGIRKGLVYYENKDTQEQKYFIVDYDQSVVDGVISSIRSIIAMVDIGQLPDREHPPISFECMYCDFKDICYPQKQEFNIDDIF
jgi:CRISPR/Cas system-associated exonuclease Cas4 (RecB family)